MNTNSHKGLTKSGFITRSHLDLLFLTEIELKFVQIKLFLKDITLPHTRKATICWVRMLNVANPPAHNAPKDTIQNNINSFY